MILIPDIHINSQHWDRILNHLESIAIQHDDREILLLGDYVYMFSYDRSMLIRLFKLLVQRTQSWKVVKVMSGNHDRLSGHFVFEEGKHSFESLSNTSIEFITQPTHRVDAEKTLHVVLPYHDQLHEPHTSSYYKPDSWSWSPHQDLVNTITLLMSSSKKWEQLSWLINKIALCYYETNKDVFDRVVIYHHYYVAKTQFPWVQATFSFQDKALHPWLCSLDKLFLVSWHIHEPFSYHNYLCCGSLRHTSQLETNEFKYYFVGTPWTWFDAFMLHTNPHIVVDSLDDIDESIQSIIQQSHDNLKWTLINTIHTSNPEPSQTHITLVTHDYEVKTSEQKLLSAHEQYSSFRVKYQSTDIVADFWSTIQSDYRSSFSDRKTLLWEYLWFKYPDQKQSLMDFLEENKIV